jgi:hypothetical protein
MSKHFKFVATSLPAGAIACGSLLFATLGRAGPGDATTSSVLSLTRTSRNQKLGAMIERAGYPGAAADLDLDKVAAILPA